MKRSPLAALAPLLLVCTLSGCQLETWEDVLDENPVTEKAFWGGVVLGAGPPILALSPVTIPLAAVTEGREGVAFLLFPGFPTGILGGFTLALPTLVVETIARLPARIWEHARGKQDDPPLPPVSEPEEAPEYLGPGYRDWPDARNVPD
jgi:hypothetical protein